MHLIWLSAALTALLSFTAPASQAADAAPGLNPAPATVAPNLATAAVQSRTLPREYLLDGLVEATDRSTVSAQTAGQVQEVLFDVNDRVPKDAVIVRLRDTEHRARVAQATADRQSAVALVGQAREEYARVKGLYEKKNVSASAMDKATADLASTQAALDAAGARLELAQEQLRYTEVRAPYSGIVTERKIQVGEMASPGQPLMSGISLDALRVAVDVPQSVIPAVRDGASVVVYLPDGTPIESKAITVFPYADPGSNTFRVRVNIPPASNPASQYLFPGMYVKTGFMVGNKAEIVVPRGAVVHRSEVTGVYVLGEDGQVHFRQVRLGRALDDGWVVLAGLAEGERVALDPIAAGVALKSQDEARRTAAAGARHG